MSTSLLILQVVFSVLYVILFITILIILSYITTIISSKNTQTNYNNDLKIVSYSAEGTSIFTAMQNIVFSAGLADIVFITQADYLKELIEPRFNSKVVSAFPRINVDEAINYTYSEIPGYISYSTKNNRESYIGASLDSIFIQDDNAKKEIIDLKTDGDGYLISFPVKITSGTFKNKKLLLVHITQTYGVDGYEGLNSYKIVYALFDYIVKKLPSELIIIAGDFNIRNELIQLAMERTGLHNRCKLYPDSTLVTSSDYEGASNPDAILIDYTLIKECDSVKVETYAPWTYENRQHFILSVTLCGFKDINWKTYKEKARTKWAVKHAYSNHIGFNSWQIPFKFLDAKLENKNIRSNPKFSFEKSLNNK